MFKISTLNVQKWVWVLMGKKKNTEAMAHFVTLQPQM